MSSLKYWVWLSSISGIGAVSAAALLRHFDTPEDIYNAGAEDYVNIEGIKPREIKRLMQKDIEPANEILASCAHIKCRVVTLQDAEYPDRLKSIFDPPIVLYVRGALPAIDDEPVVSIVGTRKCTPYGIKATENIAYALSRRGITVATGLARGIDTAAVRGALRGGGCVLGVIGCGLDIVYPPENTAIFKDVLRSGAIISEYPPGSPPIPPHFPARNRIISGLSLGVTVIEAPAKSGALITASRALEQGRDVFVLPGNVDSRCCEGSNALLREGAIPILSAGDIISEYAELYPDKIISEGQAPSRSSDKRRQQREVGDRSKSSINSHPDNINTIDNEINLDYIGLDKLLGTLSGNERAVAEAIGNDTLHVDEIIIKTGLPAHQVSSALTMLELNGRAASDGSRYFKLVMEQG